MALSIPSPNVSLQDGLQAAGANKKNLDILYGEQGKLSLEFKERKPNAVGCGPWLELLVDAPNEHINIKMPNGVQELLRQ